MKFTTVELAEHAEAFRSAGGQMLVKMEWRAWAYSPTGGTYRSLALTNEVMSSARRMYRECYSYQDPHGVRTGTLFTSGAEWPEIREVELDGISFSRVVAPREITLLPLPPMRSPLHLYRRPSAGQLIYVSTDRYWQGNPQLDPVKVFVGDRSALHEVQISQRPGYSNESSRYVTADGTLYVPLGVRSPNNLDEKRRRAMPRWEGEQLEELMFERFLIVETGAEVRLSLDPGHSSWDITNAISTIVEENAQQPQHG